MKGKEELLAELTLEEKAALLEGYKNWETNPIPNQDIPSIYLTDGPLGVRKISALQSKGAVGLGETEKSTCFPSLANLSTSWDEQLAKKEGEGIGKESHFHGVDVVLAPAMNLKRDPRCGRNFEYFSEDPLLSGRIASAYVKGIQKAGTGACLKHFACNNLEGRRFSSDSIVDQRALHELYLKNFALAIKDSQPETVMCSYNYLNEVCVSENKYLLTDVLRKEMGFKGLVMTDWGATKDRVKGVEAGVDLSMPGGVVQDRKDIIKAVKDGILPLETLNNSVRRVLTLIEKRIQDRKLIPEQEKTIQENEKLAEEIALKSAVLLKNDGVLPLKNDEKILAVGYLFSHIRYQGAGSSGLNPIKLVSIKEAFDQGEVKYDYVQGYEEKAGKNEEKLYQEALRKAEDYQTVLFFGGLTAFEESEGYDRKDLKISSNQVRLIEGLINEGKKVVLVLFGGSPVELPFEGKLAAILNMYLPGEMGGEATRKLLFGLSSPEGHLAETWVKKTEDIFRFVDFGKDNYEEYRESIFIGYRYYDKAKGKVRYPFGYGLSYTSFTHSDFKVTSTDKVIKVSLKVKNNGEYEGGDLIQVYVGKNPQSKVFKAEKELIGFKKVHLKPKEEKEIKIEFKTEDLSYFNPLLYKWVLENGTYPLYIATDANSIIFKDQIEIKGEKEIPSPYSASLNDTYDKIADNGIDEQTFLALLNKKQIEKRTIPPFTTEDCLKDFVITPSGKAISDGIISRSSSNIPDPATLPDGEAKDALIRNKALIVGLMPSMSLRVMVETGGGAMSLKVAEGMVAAANGDFVKYQEMMNYKEEPLPLPIELAEKKSKD
ncbi:MAG: glycoside hydrolase family 3 C-terminal domain-containing protein [Bacilli bacterium]|jgi:beta-glucosidase|nr:glycoside hydrolase family 3 C-terminal domain-containing protein [Bacilli bacterium]